MAKKLLRGKLSLLRYKKLFKILLLFIFFGFLLFVVYYLSIFKKIEFVDSTYKEDEVSEYLSPYMEKSLFILDFPKMVNNLNQNVSGIKNISFRRKFPLKLEVSYITRQPVAVIETLDKEIFRVDDEGYILEKLPKEQEIEKPILLNENSNGFEIGDSVGSESFLCALSLYKFVSIRDLIKQIEISSQVTATLESGLKIVVSNNCASNQTNTSINALDTIITSTFNQGKIPVKVDLRFANPYILY